jgi:hypothetical protein
MTATTGPNPTLITSTNAGIPSNTSDDELPIGAKAGIVIGSVLGFALVAAICWLAWVLHKKSKNDSQYTSHDQAELVQQMRPKSTNLAVSHFNPSYDQTQCIYDHTLGPYETHARIAQERHELAEGK